jgi:transcriptional regulator with XRE-family HTH domain
MAAKSLVGRGRGLLRRFLETNRIAQAQFAKAMGVSEASVSGWVSDGGRQDTPRDFHRKRIERWTKGAVPADSWVTADEKAAIEEIEPFAPSQT